jgi:NADPH-dependent 2,4-dienoyl-CoA reductase/sulfur reductase-like enzyme
MTDRREFDVLVIGAGPAGLAAACCAAEASRRVGIVDDNPAAGGQIWRGAQTSPSPVIAAKWFQRIRDANIDFLAGARVVNQTPSHVLLAESDDKLFELACEKVILATGARERFLPFPGWTLPGVTGAGGLQALVKSGMPIDGKRVVVAGSGPLLLPVAAYLHKVGAVVTSIAEQADRGRVVKFGLSLISEGSRFWQAVRLKWQLRGVPYLTGCWPIRADGDQTLQRVTLRRGDRTWEEPCDYLACGFGLVPNIELPMLIGCALQSGAVGVDDWQETSVTGIYCAGEPTGIGGLELSLIEGQIAGYAAAGMKHRAERLFAARAQARKFAERLERTFELRDELRKLPEPATIVCRCEDVLYEQLRGRVSWRDAKLQTRCGMGPCQGRICGTATEFLFGWGMTSVRPPLFPVRLENLAKSSVSAE